MPAHIIIEVHVRDAELYEDYRHRLPSTMAEFGGVPVVRGFADILEGDTQMDRISVIEFPDRQSALAWFSSPKVQALGDQRRSAADVTVRVVAA
ncbi:DUF1330 domain-containing protein [Aquamicrobium lusatiense]|uniref:DUF1330 domain-containing protein n=1 Tax=Aquamicrobium lusatiense TaxID=89772 RepID=UPI002453C4C7|nr:DUF1330 domain-containing protein [Aquamicrobium lusatiense]MDH4989774.1 DUF1330 domain-containing protein [Aquamicrobium lusatiense]